MRPANIQSVKNEVSSYNAQNTGKLYRDYYCQLGLAMGVLVPYYNKPNYCVVLDLDETILDKSALGKSCDYGYTNEVLVEGWTSTNIPAFQPMKQLMKLAISKNIKVYIITARIDMYTNATVKQLEINGITEGEYYTKLILKPASSIDNTVTFKSQERKKLQELGLTILLNIGDKDDDLYNPDGTLSSLFTVLLPNYMY
jgi:predicted secreted acid phosphatase